MFGNNYRVYTNKQRHCSRNSQRTIAAFNRFSSLLTLNNEKGFRYSRPKKKQQQQQQEHTVHNIDTIESLMRFWGHCMKSETSFYACRCEFASGTIINNNSCYSAENIARVLYFLERRDHVYVENFVATSRMSNQTEMCIIVGSFFFFTRTKQRASHSSAQTHFP